MMQHGPELLETGSVTVNVASKNYVLSIQVEEA
jgi:hypothetical protein